MLAYRVRVLNVSKYKQIVQHKVWQESFELQPSNRHKHFLYLRTRIFSELCDASRNSEKSHQGQDLWSFASDDSQVRTFVFCSTAGLLKFQTVEIADAEAFLLVFQTVFRSCVKTLVRHSLQIERLHLPDLHLVFNVHHSIPDESCAARIDHFSPCFLFQDSERSTEGSRDKRNRHSSERGTPKVWETSGRK